MIKSILEIVPIKWSLFTFVYILIFILAVWKNYEDKITYMLYTDNKNYNLIIVTIFYMTIASVLNQVFYGFMRSKMYVDLTIKFFKKISFETTDVWDKYYDKTELTKIILNDNRVFISVITDIVRNILKGMVDIVLISYFLLTQNVKYFLFAAIICTCRTIILERIAVYWEKKMDKVKEIQAEIEKYMVEFINNSIQMQLYGLQDIYLKIVKNLFNDYKIKKKEEILIYSIFMFIFFMITKITEIGIYFIVERNDFSIENISLIVIYFKTISDTVQSLSDINKNIVRNKDSIERIIKYNKQYATQEKKTIKLDFYDNPRIEFKNVSFKYPTRDEYVFKNLNKTITNKKYIITGKSGRGKTTLIKLLLGLYKVNEGEILINNVNIDKLSKDEIHKIFCLIPQEPIILEEKTLKENITLFVDKPLLDEDIIDMLNRVRLNDVIDKYNEKIVSLSGGQKQRLAIARALLSNNPIIIFDEAFSALDMKLKRDLEKLMYKTCREKTVLMITHDNRNIFKRVEKWEFK